MAKRKFIDMTGQRFGYEKRKWGEFYTIKEDAGYKVKILIILPKEMLSLQLHNKRSENWVILEGNPSIYLGDDVNNETGCWFEHKPQDTIIVAKQQWHRIANNTDKEVVILETQFGKCEESDIIRRDDKYGRV